MKTVRHLLVTTVFTEKGKTYNSGWVIFAEMTSKDKQASIKPEMTADLANSSIENEGIMAPFEATGYIAFEALLKTLTRGYNLDQVINASMQMP